MKKKHLAICIYVISFLIGPVILKAELPASIQQLINERETDYGKIELAIGSLTEDRKILIEIIELSQKQSYYEGLSFASNHLGILFRNLSEYEIAKRWHEKALVASNECFSKDFRILSYNMLGVVYRRIGEVRLALDNHKVALEMAEFSADTSRINLRAIAIARNSIGNIYLTLRQFDLAEAEFLSSLKIEEKIENKLGLAINHQNLGSIYEEREEFDKALLSYKQSLSYNQEINSAVGRVICFNSIGQVYIKQNLFDKAIELIEPTIASAEKIGDKYYMVMAKTNMGWALLKQGRLKESEKFLLEVSQVSLNRNITYYLAQANQLLSELKSLQGDSRASLNYYKLYIENKEKYLNESNQQYMTDLILKYDADKRESKINLLEKENELVNLRLLNNQKIFIAILICLILLSVILYFLSRQKRLKKEKEYLALEQKLLRSQMNPHFIFNSLNSIKLFVINNESEKAAFYLNKFSKFIRTILSASQEKDNTLEEELKTMNLYINIENIRFSNDIQYNIEIEEGLTLASVKVPTLILQPFLENAIWHGLSTKEGVKQIFLYIQKINDSQLSIEIVDNGIGRKKATQNRKLKKHLNESVGLKITEERLFNYYASKKSLLSLEIIDLYDENQAPEGTKVVLKIPFE